MKFKGIMLIFLLAILTIGVVSASDDLATDVANVVSDESVDLSAVDGADESIGDSVAPGDDYDVLSSDFKYGDSKLAQNHHNFSVIQEKIDPYVRDQTIELSGYYESDGSSISIQSSYDYQSTLTINGNGATLDGKGISSMISSFGTNVVLNDIIFVNAYDDFDGSHCAVLGNNLTINNCTFVNCTPGKSGGGGGAIGCYYGYLIVNECSFVNCSSTGWGAAIAFGSDCDADGNCFISNCNFLNCSSKMGGAICFESDYGEKDLNCSILNCSFVDCSSEDGGGAICSFAHSITSNVNVLKCSFENCFSGNTTTGIGGAIYLSNGNFSVSDCTFLNCHASSDGGAIVLYESNSSVSDCSFVNCSACLPNYSLDDAQGGAIYLGWSNSSVSDCSFVDCYATYAGGAISLKDGSYSVSKSSFLSCSASEYGGGIYFNSKNSKLSESYFKGNSAKNGSDWYSEYGINNTITKVSTDLEATNVIATYGGSKNLVITLKDANGNVLSNKQVKISLNGQVYYRNTTSEGKVVFAVPTNLAPKSYDAELSFAGDDKYIASSKVATVEVKKANPKITAKKATFKAKVKTKKYTITLKANNKVMKNAKVTLKVNKKTYTTKTNSKGKATFKITKLTKKGTFKATITYKATKYYNKATKTVKITVKK